MPIKATPKDREQWATLPAMTPLPVEVIEKPKSKPSAFEDGGETLDLLCEVFDGPYAHEYDGKPSKLHVYVGITMGSNNQGKKSMCRQLVEAVYGTLTDDQAYALDLEQLKGARFVLVGNYKDENAEVLRLKPIGFARYEGSAAAPVTAAPAAAADEYQYNEGRTHRWKPGMAEWEPVVQATPPPPPPAAAAPPPPRPAPPVVTPPPATPPPAPSGEKKIDF
jgi:hypothetical protein